MRDKMLFSRRLLVTTKHAICCVQYPMGDYTTGPMNTALLFRVLCVDRCTHGPWWSGHHLHRRYRRFLLTIPRPSSQRPSSSGKTDVVPPVASCRATMDRLLRKQNASSYSLLPPCNARRAPGRVLLPVFSVDVRVFSGESWKVSLRAGKNMLSTVHTFDSTMGSMH